MRPASQQQPGYSHGTLPQHVIRNRKRQQDSELLSACCRQVAVGSSQLVANAITVMYTNLV